MSSMTTINAIKGKQGFQEVPRGEGELAEPLADTVPAVDPDEGSCSECGAPCFVTPDGVSHHEGDGADGIDYDADLDHTALLDTSEAVTVPVPDTTPQPFSYATIHGSLDEQLAAEAAAATDTGRDPLDPDAHWSWTGITAEIGAAHAAEMFEKTNGSTGAALAVAAQEWNEVTKDENARRAVIAAGHKPSDFTSADRTVRMSACSARGDMAFDGELLSRAYALTSHGDTHPSNQNRVIATPITDAWTRLALRDRGPQRPSARGLSPDGNRPRN